MTGTALLVALQQVTLTGVVRDSVDLEPVTFARVTVATVGGETVAASGDSDRFGAFVLPGVTAAGPVRVEVRAFGYAGWTRTYDVPPPDPIRVLLTPAPIGLEGIEVAVGGRAGDPMSLSRDAFMVDSVLLRSFPTILETDVLRATHVSPSASAVSDYISVPFIRGGTSEGTPVMLDGVRLFNAFHVGGFVSAVNAEVVKRATVLSGSGGDGIAAGSLSGAIDIATRDGSRDRRRMAGSLGLASSRLSVEGPVGESASYLLDGRRTYIDGLTAGLDWVGLIDKPFPYFFRDLHAKVTSDLGGIRRLSVSGYLNSESLTTYHAHRDAARKPLELEMNWGNAAFSAHYRGRLGANGIVDANLGHSRFASDLLKLRQTDGVDPGNPDGDTLLAGDGVLSETRADLRATWRAGRATITAATQATRFTTEQGYRGNFDVGIDFLGPLALGRSLWRLAAYSTAEVTLRRGFSARVGLRVDRFHGLATTLAGEAQVSYAASWWDARISVSRSHQGLASLRNEEALAASFLAYDLLVPVSEAPVPRNTEFSIGWEGARGGLRVRLDAYTRALDHLRLPALGNDPIGATVLGDPSLWELGSGRARGIEAFWSWMWERGITVLGGYRWAGVSRTVGSRTFTPRFHRDHELELGSSYRRGASSWSARVSLRSGQPVTPVLAIIPIGRRGPYQDTELLVLGGAYNSAKLPCYARIDVGWRREREVSWLGGGLLVPYFSVANLFSLPNVVGWEMEKDSGGEIEKVYVPQLPMIPFFGVDFRF